jgi:BirA family transcriptional regulator, biotin operon repressor / biotin---[acetyl-CoA-carboxylase] ligase
MAESFKNIHYFHFDTIDSTNKWVKENVELFLLETLNCVSACEQTKGYGRFNRKWLSPKGYNLYFTLFFTLPSDSKIVPNLSQVLSLSCLKVLARKGIYPMIKWPNDLHLSGKKCAGVLTETFLIDKYLGVALGMGLNVNMPRSFFTEIDQPVTSLFEESGCLFDLKELLHEIVEQFSKDLTCLKEKGFSIFHTLYVESLLHLGTTISFSWKEEKRQGIAQGVTLDGYLQVLTKEGFLTVSTSGS